MSALIPLISTILDKILPDRNQSDQLKIKLIELEQSGELQKILAEKELLQGQIDTNKIDAASSDPFTRRWRPFIGWICGLGLLYQFLAAPLLTFIAQLYGSDVVAPSLDIGDLITILLGLLGLGGLRSVEKIKGVSK